jgi:hypothetical protein
VRVESRGLRDLEVLAEEIRVPVLIYGVGCWGRIERGGETEKVREGKKERWDAFRESRVGMYV